MRVAAIDIGTNSVLLLVAEVLDDGSIAPVVERATITRLGRGVDRSRKLDPAAAERTLACLERYAGEVRALGASRIAAVGTSALRDAEGGAAFVERASAILGATPRIITGAEEAELTFEGALVGLDLERDRGPVGVFDIGGGSTEIIVGRPPRTIHQRVSLDIGSVRLTERHARSDPPLPAEIDAMRRDTRAALEASGLSVPDDPGTRARWVGVAGTVTTLAAIAHAIDPYDAARIHGARLDAEVLGAIFGLLSGTPLAERRQVRGLEPARADVIVAGAIIACEIVSWARIAEVIVSDRGIRWALARRLSGSTPSEEGAAT